MNDKSSVTTFDFIAELIFLSTEEGGRKTPVFSGYRPQVKFELMEVQTSGEQTFLNKEEVNPGDSVIAGIRLLGIEYFNNFLEEGMLFDFREGSRIIGTGKVTNILNQKLKNASR